MGQIPEPMHDIADRDSRSGKQSTHSASKENRDADCFSLPGMRRGAEIGGEAQVEGGDHDKERGPEYLFPSSLEDASKDENASDRAEQTDNEIQQSHDQPADELAARSSPGRQVLQQRRIH